MIDRRSRNALPLVLMTAVLTLAGCAHGPRQANAPSAVPATRTSEIDAIVLLLDQGNTDAATKRVKALLKHDPSDPQARVLDDSLTKDPVALLGPKSFPYTVSVGDTMLGLSERFLGTRLKSYQLARYNDVAVPSSLAAGTVLRIPGEPPREAAPARAEPTPARAAPAVSHPKPAAPVKAAPPPPEKAKTDPAMAAKMRAAGLAALNQGHVDRAVALLRQAAALDPANTLIARDRDRAERISRTVKSRH